MHQGKSGTRARPQKGASRVTSKKPYLSPAVRHAIMEGMASMSRFPRGSTLANRAATQMFVELIRKHGVETCVSVLIEFIVKESTQRSVSVFFSCFVALTCTHHLKEAKQLMRRLGYREHQRIAIYEMMGIEAPEEEKREILATMRELVLRVEDPSELFDSRIRIYSVTRDPADCALALHSFEVVLARSCKLSLLDVEALVYFAALKQDVELWHRVFGVLKDLRDAPSRAAGESRFWEYIAPWNRQQLSDLLVAAEGTPYAQRIRGQMHLARDVELNEEGDAGLTS